MKKTKQQNPINITEVLAQLAALAPTPTEPEYKQLKKYRPAEWDFRRRTMLTQFIEDWGTEDPEAVEQLLQELRAHPEKYDPEFLLQVLTKDPLDDLYIGMTSEEHFQKRLDYLEALKAKWLQDPIKYLGESCGLILENHNKEIAQVQKQMEKALTDPARLAPLARNEKRAVRAIEWSVASSATTVTTVPARKPRTPARVQGQSATRPQEDRIRMNKPTRTLDPPERRRSSPDVDPSQIRQHVWLTFRQAIDRLESVSKNLRSSVDGPAWDC